MELYCQRHLLFPSSSPQKLFVFLECSVARPFNQGQIHPAVSCSDFVGNSLNVQLLRLRRGLALKYKVGRSNNAGSVKTTLAMIVYLLVPMRLCDHRVNFTQVLKVRHSHIDCRKAYVFDAF